MSADWSKLFGFPLGEPPHDDVEGAAALLVRYGREAPLDEDKMAMFLQMCAEPEKVLARARKLGAAAAEPAA
jgi:hypothetical protein